MRYYRNTIGRPFYEHLLFASNCPACEVVASSLCGVCRDEVRSWSSDCCLRCGADHIDSCFCERLPEAVRSVTSLWRFEDAVADVIEGTKQRAQLWRIQRLRREIGGWLRAVVVGGTPRPVIAPVPPVPARLRRRGFDLPAVLASWYRARPVSRVSYRLLRRTRGRSVAQATLNRDQRFAAAEGAYRAGRAPERVLVLDDVITTGATVSACARALAEAGARVIDVVSIARTPRFDGDDDSG